MKATPYLSRSLPPELTPLLELTTDLRWTWSHAADVLWKMMDADAWDRTENPYVVLQGLSEVRIKELASDPQFKKRLQAVASARDKYCSCPAWFGENYLNTNLKGIAYFSMEFGLGEALPLYAGGLGILAGDYLKAASDLGVPLIGIGLLYQEGYFRQVLDKDGWQHEVYPYNDPTTLPVVPVEAPSGGWLKIYLDFPGRRVRFRVWQAQVGRITLYLLDSNDPWNNPSDRGITNKLYGGGPELRLAQEVALGICGWRLIESLGLEIDVCHLNEGHAAFATLERARCYMDRHDIDFHEALWTTRAGNIFTTHTPVAAGFDAYRPELVLKYGDDYAKGLGVELHNLAALGRKEPSNPAEPFNMAYLAMRTCAMVNGVSQLHGDVSQRIFSPLFPRWPLGEIPVSAITNGIHVPTWDSPWADELWTKAASKGRWLGDPEALAEAIESLSDENLWTFRGNEKADLVNYTRQRLVRQLGQRGESTALIGEAENILDPNALTLGFARRFAEYKRPNLLLHDQQRLIRLLTNTQRPVQIIIAGKAHPQDEQGKRFIQAWAQFVRQPEVRRHAVFLEDYDMALAQELVHGVDVWINTPRRPWEACGTSGMKVLVNGGLNLSELDGWWAEAYNKEVGWALGNGEEHQNPDWDGTQADRLYQLLEEKIVPAYYDRDAAGIPRGWVTRLRASMAQLAPQYSTNRMMREYVERMYLPAATAYNLRQNNSGQLVKTVCTWEQSLKRHWQDILFGNLEVTQEEDGWTFLLQVYLGGISPDSIQVQLYADNWGDAVPLCQIMERRDLILGAINGYIYYGKVGAGGNIEEITPRVVPHHPDVFIPIELPLICWKE